MKIFRIFAIPAALIAATFCPLFVFAQDTVSVDTQFIADGIAGFIRKGKEILADPSTVSFDYFYLYVTASATYILGVVRNFIPNWKLLQNVTSSGIPREVTVALLGLSVVLFIVLSGFNNIDWGVLIMGVFGTMGFYATVKSVIDKIPNELIRGALLFLLGKVSKPENAEVKP